MKSLYCLAFCFMFLFISCQEKQTKTEVIVARVFNAELTETELATYFNGMLNKEDSTAMADVFIDKWVRKQLMLHIAEKRISSDLNIEKLVNDYRSSLILENFERLLLKESLDTIMSQDLIDSYYKKNIDQFKLHKDIVQCIYAVFPSDIDSLSDFKQNFTSKNFDAVIDFCRREGKDTLLKRDQWFEIKSVKSTLNQMVIKKQKWEGESQTHISKNGFDYFLWVFDIKKSKEDAPLSFVKESIIKIILHEKKKGLIKSFENEQLSQEIKNKNVTLY